MQGIAWCRNGEEHGFHVVGNTGRTLGEFAVNGGEWHEAKAAAQHSVRTLSRHGIDRVRKAAVEEAQAGRNKCTGADPR